LIQREIAGYEFADHRYENDGYVTYRVRQAQTGLVLLAKGPTRDFPPVAEVRRLEHELAILREHRELKDVALKPVRRIDNDRNSFLLFEFFPGTPVRKLDRRWDAEELASFARGLFLALASCHGVGVVHQALTPDSVLWDDAQRKLLLGHFVHAKSALDSGESNWNVANLSVYSAPEQTGQMKVAVDYRADLYAAGAVLYELATGRPPIEAARDAADVAHRLLTVRPTPLEELAPHLSSAFCALIAALLAKNPSDRPQNAEEALAALDASLGVAAREARSPAPPALEAPRLCGRDEPLEQLRALARQVADGASRMVCIAGEPGSGKSRLCEALRSVVAGERFLFVSGKFDQYRNPRPYSALLAAVEGLLDVFLSEREAELTYWRTRLHAIEPALRAVLIELVPNLATIVGGREAPLRLGPTETQNRFHFAFRALLDALCDREHPLVLVIDDLQWADEETLALLGELFVKNDRPYSLVLVAYRPQEAKQAHGVTSFLNGAQSAAERPAALVELNPLGATAIAQLCADVVNPCTNGDELARVVERGSRGNPLFAVEIIKHLRAEGALRWAASGDGFAWSLEAGKTRQLALSENVVDLIVGRIHHLPDEARRVLTTAAVVGHTFAVADLTLAAGVNETALHAALRMARDEGLIMAQEAARGGPDTSGDGPDSQPVAFSFFHDRIQQAAHSLCSEADRLPLHLVLGRSLVRQARENREALFAGVDHLNQVADALTAEERGELARLDVQAGTAAKEAIAYRTAASLFAKALTLLAPADSAPRRLRFEAQLLLAESLYLAKEFIPAERAFDVALANATDADEEVEVQRTRLVLYQHQHRYQEAVTSGLRALSLLGMKLPEHPHARLLGALASTMVRVRSKDTAALLQRPDQASEVDRKILDLLVLLWTPSFWVKNLSLNTLIVLALLEMTLRLGNTAQAPMAYVCFGILNHALFKRSARGLEFGRLALGVLEQNEDPFIASRVRFLALTYFGPFDRDNAANVAEYESALARCLVSGEHVFAGHTIDGITTSLPVHGFRLEEIERKLDACAVSAERIGSETSATLIRVIRAWCKALSLGPRSPHAVLPADVKLEASHVGVQGMLQMITSYLWDDDAEVLRLAKSLRGHNVVQGNPLHATLYALFQALSLCRARGKNGYRKAARLLGPVRKFAAIFPANFRSMLLLGEAELARTAGDGTAALDGYHRAIVEATAHGHDLIHALSCERVATYWESRNDQQQRVEYLRVACYGYERFGATAKADQLARKYPTFELPRRARDGVAHVRSVDLGVEAVMRAAYAIAEETRGDQLARNLLRVIATSAGAQRAFLLREFGPELKLVARWDGDAPHTLDIGALGSEPVSQAVVRYAARTKNVVHIPDARKDPRFGARAAAHGELPRSVLCLPLVHRGTLLAVLYLENSVCADVFTEEQERLSVMLGQQAAVTLAISDYHKVQIEALQAKINPHFLHNTLSVIAQLIVSDTQKAEAAVLKLSRLYRYVLNASADQMVSLDQELGVVRDYLTLEQYRFGERLQVAFHVEGATDRLQVPALLLQPLAENAVRYGVARKVGVGCVCIRVQVGPTHCKMCVEDDGPGWQDGTSGTGFGLRSVRERLALLYPGQFELTIEKRSGVSVQVTIPAVHSASPPGGRAAAYFEN
jgi:predicted ATPase/GAF domain-containing protein